MDEIRKIAQEYFAMFEGLDCYPPFFSRYTFALAASVLFFLAGNISFIWLANSAGSKLDWHFVLAVGGDLAIFLGTQYFRLERVRRMLASANSRSNANFKTIDASKKNRLIELFDCRPHDFSRVAIEIQTLRAVEKETSSRVAPGLTTELRKAIANERDTERVLAMLLAVVAIVVTLAAAGTVSLDNIFAAVEDRSFWNLIGILVFLGVLCMMVWIALRLSTNVLIEVFFDMGTKFSTSRWADERRTNYLVNDLVRLHKRPPI